MSGETSFGDRLRSWWTGCSRPKALQAESRWLTASVLRTAFSVSDVDIGEGEFLHTLRCPGDPSKPAVVLLHGYGQGLGCFGPVLDPLVDRLGAHRGDVFVVDWLGCGLSSRPSYDAKNTAEAEDFFVESLERWRSQMGLEKVAICGRKLSLGLSTALHRASD